MAEYAGQPKGSQKRVAVIASRFNESITSKLVEGAMDALQRHGAAPDDIDLVWVPGAWELPIVARRLLATDRYDALVAVGAVIRGETPHFDYVAGEAARGLGTGSAEDERKIAGLLLRTLREHRKDLDARLVEVTTNWRLERLGVIERCVLRLAAAELQAGETPPRVIIREAIRLAERYGTPNSARFVNGVLDALARKMGRL